MEPALVLLDDVVVTRRVSVQGNLLRPPTSMSRAFMRLPWNGALSTAVPIH